MVMDDAHIRNLIGQCAISFENNRAEDALIETIGDASVVLIGEATHGTQEFYAQRAAITKRLVTQKGFRCVIIEGDWPDAYTVNRYINNKTASKDNKQAVESLQDFKRFPAWMWRNNEMVSFVQWLHEYNAQLPESAIPVGFYGMDLYSLHRSMRIVVEALEKLDTQEAQRARERYQCFELFHHDPHAYGYYATVYPESSCRVQALEQLTTLMKKDISFFKYDALNSMEEKLYMEQNARVVKNAEHYYRSIFEGNPAHSWNVRDNHMMETVTLIRQLFEQRYDQDAKVIIWAHNSHIGDARATQMAQIGEHNIGQLAKQEWDTGVFTIGFTTYTGTVSAARAWEGPVERRQVLVALPDSYEALLHQVGIPRFLLLSKWNEELYKALHQKRLERAIGVLYIPETERESHYFYAHLSEQFDAIIHIDTTTALTPLDKTVAWDRAELPETFPSGM
ncbi:MAG: erythromycin esterase family protein [Candidatus Babeliales bacterium]